MNFENFLPQDQWQAKKEHACVADCIYTVQVMMDSGGYESVEKALENALRSARSLKEMQYKKKLHDEKTDLALQLKKAGVDIEATYSRV